MATEHPFQALFETFGRVPAVHAESVNRGAYEQMWGILAVGPEQAGRCILLKSPRAGHGKTHLLSRLQHHLGADHEFIPLHAAHGSHIDAATVTGDVLARLSRPLPAGGGLTVLDLLIRKLFALALQPLVRSGEVPCEDREGALAALRNRPVETFDFHHPNAVTAHWARENFDVLGPRLATELAQLSGSPMREVTFWVSALFRLASTPLDHPTRTAVLLQVVNHADPSPSLVFERLGALLSLISQVVRVVLVADDLEGFSSDESAALRLASFLGSLRHSADRVDAIVSLNQDIWDSAFVPRLSGGLADRLAEIVVELEPLDRDQMVNLLDARAPGLGMRIFERLEASEKQTHARGILRAAGLAWASASQHAHPAPSATSPTRQEGHSAHLDTPLVNESEPTSLTPSGAFSPSSHGTGETAQQLQQENAPPSKQSPALTPIAFEQSVSSAGGTPFTVPAHASTEAFPAQPTFPVQPAQPSPETPTPVASTAQATHNTRLPTSEASGNPFSNAGATFFDPSATPTPVSPWSSAEPVVNQPEFKREKSLAEVLANAAAEESSSPIAHPSSHSPTPPAARQTPTDGLSRSAEASTAIFGFGSASGEPPTTPGGPASVPTVPSEASLQSSEAAPSPAPETDRVDELLRQFRERYSKG